MAAVRSAYTMHRTENDRVISVYSDYLLAVDEAIKVSEIDTRDLADDIHRIRDKLMRLGVAHIRSKFESSSRVYIMRWKLRKTPK